MLTLLVLLAHTSGGRLQEEDREYLIRQLVAVKRDNARLRQEMLRNREDLEKVQKIADEQVCVLLLLFLLLSPLRRSTACERWHV